MIFDSCHRRISEITDQELIDLIGNQEEDQWIDFKQQDYHRDPTDQEEYKREICKDITAMANAEGGYIFIGVQETAGLARGFLPVSNPDKIARSINSVCLQSIEPRIPNLEIKKRSFQWNGRNITLVIIHIPPTQLDAISRNIQQSRRSSMSPQEDALEQQGVRDLLHLMKLRFEEAISDEPYYRILAVPTTLNSDTVSTQEQEIHTILRNPPNIRRTGFGFIGVERIEHSSEGIKGIDVWGYELGSVDISS